MIWVKNYHLVLFMTWILWLTRWRRILLIKSGLFLYPIITHWTNRAELVFNIDESVVATRGFLLLMSPNWWHAFRCWSRDNVNSLEANPNMIAHSCLSYVMIEWVTYFMPCTMYLLYPITFLPLSDNRSLKVMLFVDCNRREIKFILSFLILCHSPSPSRRIRSWQSSPSSCLPSTNVPWAAHTLPGERRPCWNLTGALKQPIIRHKTQSLL